MSARLTPQQRALREVSEADWQHQVFDTLAWCGWTYYHVFHKAGTFAGVTAPGFPDVVAFHRRSGRMLVAELKRETGKVTPEQAEWLAKFEAMGMPTYVWRPSDVDAMNRVLNVDAS